MKRFIIGRSWEDTPTKTNGMAGVITTAYFDIIDTHPLRDKRVVSYVTEEDTDGSGMNYGFAAAEEEAAALSICSVMMIGRFCANLSGCIPE